MMNPITDMMITAPMTTPTIVQILYPFSSASFGFSVEFDGLGVVVGGSLGVGGTVGEPVTIGGALVVAVLVDGTEDAGAVIVVLVGCAAITANAASNTINANVPLNFNIFPLVVTFFLTIFLPLIRFSYFSLAFLCDLLR